MRAFAVALLLASLARCPAERFTLARPAEYIGMCDASGAVALTTNLFAVACDEDNTLRIYRRDQPGPPMSQFDFNRFIRVQGKSLEADLEGAARLGDRAFWIGSHGRNRNGKERFNRHRFFATDIQLTGGRPTLVPVGRPYTSLVQDLAADSRFTRFHLAEAAEIAPKEPGALNIEGLSATPDGHLLIGFRNPIPNGRALLIPLLNPNDVIASRPARFGPACQLDLGGLGIRDLAYWGGNYLIIAGPYGAGGHFRMYRWAGGETQPKALKVNHLNRYNPEAIVIYPDQGLDEVQILSDDGTRLIDGVPGKTLTDPARQKFRSFWLVHSSVRGP